MPGASFSDAQMLAWLTWAEAARNRGGSMSFSMGRDDHESVRLTLALRTRSAFTHDASDLVEALATLLRREYRANSN